jgi:hypothetical protein
MSDCLLYFRRFIIILHNTFGLTISGNVNHGILVSTSKFDSLWLMNWRSKITKQHYISQA